MSFFLGLMDTTLIAELKVWALGVFFGSSGGYPSLLEFHQLTHNTSRLLEMFHVNLQTERFHA